LRINNGNQIRNVFEIKSLFVQEKVKRTMTAIQSLIEQLEHFANESSSKGSSNQSAEAAQQVAEELIALQAIYSEECIGLLTVQRTESGGISTVLIDETAGFNGSQHNRFDWHSQYL
jgi:hypothetical protein